MGAWFAANAVIFPKPADDRAWAGRAMLGEELRMIDRPKVAALAVNVTTTAAGVLAARHVRWVSLRSNDAPEALRHGRRAAGWL